METFVPPVTIVAVVGVGAEYVAVTAFELFLDGGFVDYAGAAVVGQGSELVSIN